MTNQYKVKMLEGPRKGKEHKYVFKCVEALEPEPGQQSLAFPSAGTGAAATGAAATGAGSAGAAATGAAAAGAGDGDAAAATGAGSEPAAAAATPSLSMAEVMLDIADLLS